MAVKGGVKSGSMRILVCGDRNWTDKNLILDRLKEYPKDVVIIEGEARGADSLARKAAEELGLEVLAFPAQWAKFGRAAGPIRNTQMLDEGKPDEVLAFHDHIVDSLGTANMLKQARRRGIRVSLISHSSEIR